MSFSTLPSAMRISNAARSLSCGIVSKYDERSASYTFASPSFTFSAIRSAASCALRLGRKPNEQSWKSASNIGSMTSLTAICTTLSFMVGMPSGLSLPFAFSM